MDVLADSWKTTTGTLKFTLTGLKFIGRVPLIFYLFLLQICDAFPSVLNAEMTTGKQQ